MGNDSKIVITRDGRVMRDITEEVTVSSVGYSPRFSKMTTSQNHTSHNKNINTSSTISKTTK